MALENQGPVTDAELAARARAATTAQDRAAVFEARAGGGQDPLGDVGAGAGHPGRCRARLPGRCRAGRNAQAATAATMSTTARAMAYLRIIGAARHHRHRRDNTCRKRNQRVGHLVDSLRLRASRVPAMHLTETGSHVKHRSICGMRVGASVD